MLIIETIIFIFSGSLILYIEIRAINNRKNKMKNSGELIEIFKHDKKSIIFYRFLLIILLFIFLFSLIVFQDSKNILMLSVELLVGISILIMLNHNYLSDTYIYDNALIINGRYVPWNHIERVKEKKFKSIAIKFKEESETSFIEIKLIGVNRADKLKFIIIRKINNK